MQKGKNQIIIEDYLKNWLFLVFALIIVSIFLFANFLNVEIFKRDMLFWFFSATSQSMAALFAVVGMFLAFWYQGLQNKLEDHMQILRSNFISSEWSQFFGYNYSREYINSYTDLDLLIKAKELLKEKKEESQNRVYINLQELLWAIESHKGIMENVILCAKVPMITILITFLISIISLLFVDLYFSLWSLNFLGLGIVLLTLVLILFSLTSILRFFVISTRVRRWRER